MKERRTTIRINSEQWLKLQNIKIENYCESLEEALDIILKGKEQPKKSHFSL